MHIYTTAGKLGFVSWDIFLALVPRKDLKTDGPYMWDERIRPYNWIIDSKGYTSPPWVRRVKHLVYPPNLKQDLLIQLPVRDMAYEDPRYMLETAATYSALELGDPTHLVRLGVRKWLIANPKDFKILANPLGEQALVCHYPKKNLIFQVSKSECRDCGKPTRPGHGSARCPACWDDRCGN